MTRDEQVTFLRRMLVALITVCEAEGINFETEIFKGSNLNNTQGSPSSTQASNFPANPIARSLSDLLTCRQLGMIRAIARQLRIEADQECIKLMRCRTDELSKRAASALIQHLQEMEKEATKSAGT